MASLLFWGIVAIIAVFAAFLIIGKYQIQKFVAVKIGNATVNAEVADTEPKQLRGLMFRDSLPRNGGMLFTFPSDGRHGIWMMNTTIPLDIIWLDSAKKVVHIQENAKPCKLVVICEAFLPDETSRYVLEVNAGYAKKHGIRTGSVAKFDA
jgi:uncharacterized membrane protein (UPF0127 family)